MEIPRVDAFVWAITRLADAVIGDRVRFEGLEYLAGLESRPVMLLAKHQFWLDTVLIGMATYKAMQQYSSYIAKWSLIPPDVAKHSQIPHALGYAGGAIYVARPEDLKLCDDIPELLNPRAKFEVGVRLTRNDNIAVHIEGKRNYRRPGRIQESFLDWYFTIQDILPDVETVVVDMEYYTSDPPCVFGKNANLDVNVRIHKPHHWSRQERAVLDSYLINTVPLWHHAHVIPVSASQSLVDVVGALAPNRAREDILLSLPYEKKFVDGNLTYGVHRANIVPQSPQHLVDVAVERFGDGLLLQSANVMGGTLHPNKAVSVYDRAKLEAVSAHHYMPRPGFTFKDAQLAVLVPKTS